MRQPTPLSQDPRFQDRLPRIAVGIVSYGDIPHQVFRSFMGWWGQSCARYKGRFHLSFGLSDRKEQYRARNSLVLLAEAEQADILLMVDDDQLLHVEPDLIGKFADFGANIMGALYFQRGGLYHPVVMHEDQGPMGKTYYRFYRPEEIPSPEAGPTKVPMVGHGCMWVDMDVYSRMKQPHHWPYPSEVVFVPDEVLGLDVHFCKRARDMGEDIYLMPNIRIGHLGIDQEEVYHNTRPPQEILDRTEEATHYWTRVGGRIVKKENTNGREATHRPQHP